MGDDEASRVIQANEVATAPAAAVGAEEDALARVAREAALWSAALEIARPGFPAGTLPRLAPVPHVNLGHVVAFDHGLHGRVVWGAAVDLRRRLKDWESRRASRMVVAAAAAATAFVLVAVVVLSSSLPGWLALLALGAAYGTYRLLGPKAEELDRDARVRRNTWIDALLKQRSLPDVALPEGDARRWIGWGDGRIDGVRAPVLVSSEARPFPGYGHKVQSNTLTVRPRAGAGGALAEDALTEAIGDALGTAARRSGFDHVMVGRVVVIDGDSLRAGSWTSADGCPRLWIAPHEAAVLMRRDTTASVRSYVAIQVVFPAWHSVATVFVRAFKSGHAASVELTLCSLGPLSDGEPVLHRLRRRLRETKDDRPTIDDVAPTTTELGLELLYRRLVGDARLEQLSELADLDLPIDPIDPKEAEELEREVRRLGDEADRLGNWIEVDSWREKRSLIVPRDAFGAVEAQAALRAIYEHLGGAILDALDGHGYDVSGYRRSDGKIDIKFDKIDNIQNLVIGERVEMGAKKAEDKGSSESK